MIYIQEEFTKINTNFDKLLRDIKFSQKDVYELCCISGNKKITDLDTSQILSVLNLLNIDLREIAKDNICSNTVKAQLNGAKHCVKPAWIGNRGTRLKTVDSALSALPLLRRAQILRKYQLTEEALKDSHRLVSAELIKSIFDDVADYSYASEVDIIGHINCKNYLESDASNEFKSFNKLNDGYVYFIEHCTSLIEKNMDYKILKEEPNRIVFQYKTKESVQEFFKVKHFGNIKFCQNIKGFFEELMGHNPLHSAVVKKLSCAHFGEHVCTYEIVFNSIMPH